MMDMYMYYNHNHKLDEYSFLEIKNFTETGVLKNFMKRKIQKTKCCQEEQKSQTSNIDGILNIIIILKQLVIHNMQGFKTVGSKEGHLQEASNGRSSEAERLRARTGVARAKPGRDRTVGTRSLRRENISQQNYEYMKKK